MPAGGRTVAHYHRVTEELYFFTSGSGRITLGDEERDVRAGDCVVIPPGQVHGLTNTGGEPLVLLCCCAPAYSHEAPSWWRFRLPAGVGPLPIMSTRLATTAPRAVRRARGGARRGRAHDRHRRPEARHVHRPALPGERPGLARRAVPWDALDEPARRRPRSTRGSPRARRARQPAAAPSRTRAPTAASCRRPNACSTSSAVSGRATRGSPTTRAGTRPTTGRSHLPSSRACRRLLAQARDDGRWARRSGWPRSSSRSR